MARIVSSASVALLVFGMLIFWFNVLPVKAHARMWTVDDDGPADFHTIQEAVDHASEGDTVYVKSGTYREEQVIIEKPLAFIGEDKNTTVIDGNGNWVCVYVQSTHDVNISGFTMRNGYGVHLYSSDNVTIVDNIISNNGQGIVLKESANSTVTRNILTLNGVTSVYLSNSSKNSVCDNIVTLNGGDAIRLDHSDENVISENHVSNNGLGIAPGYHAYGIHLSYSNSNMIYHNNIIENHEPAINWRSGNNSWDNGYPSGGNYWSDYCGIDAYSGPHQDEAGSDGIGDTPYMIDDNVLDRYPLVVGPSGHFGDLSIDDQRTYCLKDGTFNLTGRLTVKDNASVQIRNAKIYLTCLMDRWNWIPNLETHSTGPWRAVMILVEDNSKLEVDNATFVFSSPYPGQILCHFIYLNGSAEARIDHSKFTFADGAGDNIESANDSKIHITDTILFACGISEHQPTSGVVTKDNSNCYIENCLLNTAQYEGNSTVVLINANTTDVTICNNPRINMTDSRIGQINIFGPVTVYLANMLIDHLDARNSSSTWATGCHFQEVSISSDATLFLSQSEAWKVNTYDKGAILFFYDLPLFGRVVLHPNFILYMSLMFGLMVALVAAASGFLYFLRKRKMSRKIMQKASN